MSEVKCTSARAFDYRGIEYSKKPFKFSNTEAGFLTFKEWIRDIKERHEKDKVVSGYWNRPGITGSILESFYRIMK